MARMSFALRMLGARLHGDRRVCPYCGSRFAVFLQRKWLLIQARKCLYCGLIYRWPTDAAGATRAFYETGYEGQQATDVPGPEAIDALVRQEFRGGQYDKSERIAFLRRRGIAGGTLLDFGCAWGYSVHQYTRAGFRVTGFEIDRKRAAYGRAHLQLDLRSAWEDFGDAERFDVIVTDHSLEHAPDPGAVLDRFVSHLAPGGRLVAFVPNGACAAARRLGVNWGPFVGESHTVAFTPEWFARNLPRHGLLAEFFDSTGTPLCGGDYLADQGEIALVATLIESK